MTALFSCDAYKNHQQIADWCFRAETTINKSLSNKTYDGIKYLSAQFSFLNLIEETAPSRQQDHTIVLTVEIDQFDTSLMIENLLKALESPIVPDELVRDLKKAFTKKGWLNN